MNYREHFQQISGHWRDKKPEWDVQDSMLILSVLRTGFELQRRTEAVFEEFDLNTATFGMLATLYRSSTKGGMTPSELAKHVLISPGSVTNRIDRLIERGLVERSYSKEDRRIQYVTLTKQGLKLLEKVMPLHLENEKNLLRGLSASDKKNLKELIFKTLDSLDNVT